MDCKIVKNTDGKINDVLNQTGQSSSLFKQILNTPTLSLDEAIDLYKNVYSEKLQEKVIYQQLFNSLEQELQYIKQNAVANGTFMKAPNGQPTNLTEAQWLQTRTNSFKNWFGDWENKPQTASKVVDENGEPLVVYHGTDMDFTEFTNSYNKRMKGFYFSNDLNNSKTYGKNIISVFQNIKKPLVLDANNLNFTEDIEVEVIAKYPNEKPYNTKIKLPIDDIVDLTKNGKKVNSFIDIKNRENYDGVIFKNIIDPALSSKRNIPQDTFAAFNPNQIKSATENTGTFSTDSNDIRYQIIGEKGASRITEYKQLLDQAKRLDKQGKSIEEIENQTGWFKNKQGQWKYFSNEYIQQFSFKEGYLNIKNKSRAVKDVIKDNLILQAYPELKDLKVLFYDKTLKNLPREVGETNGFYNEGEETLYINVDNRDGKSLGSIFSHELTHHLQKLEGFSTGGGLNSILIYAMHLTDASKVRFNDLLNYWNTYDISGLTTDEKNVLEQAKKAYVNYKKKDDVALMYQYDRIQGEIDARAVELALKLKNEFGDLTYKELTDKIKSAEGIDEAQVVDLFYKGFSYNNSASKITQEIIDRLKQNGLSEDVFILSTEEINAKLIELGVSEDVRRQVEAWQGEKNKYEVVDDLEDNSTITLSFKQGDVTIGEVFGIYDDIEEFESKFKDSDFFIEIQDLKIKPEYQGQGFGKELLTDTLKYIQEKYGNFDVYLNASPISNRRLNAQDLTGFYSTFGFEELQNQGSNITMLRSGGKYEKFQKSLNNVGINLITNGLTYKDSKTGKDIVILNKDTADDSTSIHEFNHIFLNWAKTERPEIYKKGLELVRAELKKDSSEIADIISYVKNTQPKLTEEFLAEEILTELTGRKGAKLINSKKNSGIIDWIKEFFAEIGQMLGILDATPQEIASMTLGEFAEKSAISLLKGERIKGQEAQQYFTRNADRLPLTLAVFSRPEFVKLQGKEVNPITVLNSLNQSGIKQIEKDLIKQVIEQNYQGQKKIPYDELEATVRANITPLERIFTSSYANYGMDNLGNGNYGEANTIILNAPIEHGVTGHFSGDFKASGRKNIKYVSKQLDANTWVAVEEGYEANDNNIYQYVGTAGKKEAVDAWINNYEGYLNVNPLFEEYNNKLKEKYGEDFKKSQLTEEEFEKLYELKDLKNKGVSVNKGMFGHIRVWQDGETFTVAEMQSDYFQKNNAKQNIKLKVDYNKLDADFFKKVRNAYEGLGYTYNQKTGEVKNPKNEILEEFVPNDDFMILAAMEIDNNPEILEVKKKLQESYIKDRAKLEEESLKNRPLQEKQFIASQKIWEQRMVREAIKEASLSGATSLRFPTPYTLSVIEGYLSPSKLEGAELGGIVEYLGTDYVVVVDDNEEELTIIPLAGMTKVKISDFEELVDSGEIGDETDIYEYYLGDLGYGVKDLNEEYFYYNGRMNPEGMERISSKDTENNGKDDFEISSLNDTQQTVARKYEEIAEILKKEKPIEVVTDENGFDWYEVKIEQSDVNKPVVAFQVIGQKGASRIEEYNNLLNQAKSLEKQDKDYSKTGWYKSQDGWKYLSKEVIEDFKIINKQENKVLTLKEVLGNENVLFKIYPKMQDLSVIFYNRNAKNSEKFKPLADNERGEFDSNDKIIRINTNHKANQGNIQGLQFTLGHEVAHKIQRVESFSRGGNGTTILNEALSILNIKNTGNIGEIYSKITKADKSNLTKNQLKIVKDSSKTIEALLTNNEGILEGQYLRLLGEIDANIVGELTSKGTATGTYADLLSMYLNRENIDPESIYFISGNQVQFSLRQDFSQPRQIAVEPNLSFETPNGNTYTNYSDALKNTDEGAIKLKIDDVVIGEASSSTNINTIVGSINDLVKQSILKGERLLNPDGTISLVTEGNSFAKKLINASISEELFLGNQVKPSIDERGNISIEEKQSFYEEVKNLDYKQIKSKHGADTANIILAARIYEENTKAFGQKRLIEDIQEITPENELQERLLNLLNTLGVKTVSLNKYKENYKQRNGVLPNSNALADIANRVIAFTDGEVTQDALTEEVAHFILEAVNQEEIAPLLENIHKTDEWAQYAEEYFNIYQDEAIVRKEILGKVLKNAIQRNFEKSQQTGTANTIIGRLAEIFNKFFTRISEFITPQHRIDLDEYTKKIYDNLMLGGLVDELNQEQLEGNNLVLFQTSKTIQSETDLLLSKLNKALGHLEAQDKRLNSVSKEEILTLKEALKTEEDYDKESLVKAKEMDSKGESEDEITDETGWIKTTTGSWERVATDNTEIARATLQISNIANRHVNYLVKRDKRNLLSSEESAVFSLTVGYLAKVLTELESIISKKEGFPSRTDIVKELGRTLENIRKLQGDVGISQEQNVQRIFDKVSEELDLDEATKKQLLDNFNNITRDTNVFYAYVGGAINAHNPALNIASALISKAYADRDIAFNLKSKEFVNLAKSKGYTEEQLAGLMTKWKKGHFLFSRFDFEKAEKDMLEEKAKIFKEVFGKEVTAEQLLKDEETFLKKEPSETKKLYYKRVNDFRQENQVYTPLTEEETKKSNAIYAQVSLETQMKDKELSRKRSAITREAKRNKGFSESEKFEMEELARKRAELKNPFDNQGKLKPGLDLNEEDEVTIAEGFTVDTLEADSKLVYELSLLDKLKGENFKSGLTEASLPQKFIDALNAIDGNKEKLEFIKLNANISFSSEFWNTFDRSEGVVAKLKSKGEYTIADKIQNLTVRRKHILKASRVFNNPSEVNYEDLSGETSKTLIELESRIEELYKEANKVLDKEDRVGNEMSELVTNQAYKNEIEDGDSKNRDEKIEFIKKHVTEASKNKIESARLAVNAYKNGVRRDLPKALKAFVSAEEDVDLDEVLITYAETKLAPYFKKLQPVGFDYENLLIDIASDPTLFFSNMPSDVSVVPNYIFLGQEENSRVNPKFAKNIEEGEPQLQLYTNTPEYKDGKRIDYKYGDKDFADYFGIADLENPEATKNEKEYEVLIALYKFQDDTIEKAGMKGKHSRYLLPQQRPGALARIANIKADNKGNLKEGFKELFAYREDDAIYGQTDGKMNLGVTAVGEMTIPRHGFNRLETADEVTNELLYSYMWMAQEAELRKSRVGVLGDIESIRTILTNKSYGDKHGESTETYKMFDDFVRFNMYGQSESFSFETNFGILSKKVNLAPLVKKFQWWIRLVNLGFSVLTPLTSFLQGSVNFQIEKFVGERVDKDASRLARKQLVKLLPETMSDVMKLTSSSKLNILSEFMGQSSSLERFKNSNYNRLTRGMSSSAYMTHAAVDAPLSAQVMLTVLHDFRVVNGRLMTFAKFAEENKSKTRKEARTAWASYEDKVLFNYIEIKDGVAQTTDALRTEIPDIDKRMQNVRNSITVAKQEVDSQISSIDRTKMQRHALLSFLTLHKGWLITSMTRRFKSKHLNLYTGLEEEGSYSGTFGSDSFFSDLVQSWKKEGVSFKAVKENWKNSSVTRRRSITRVASDIAITNTLVLVALLLKNAADDDDDKDYVTQFASYMSYRLAVEVTSQSTAFSNQVYKFLENPTVGMSQIQNVLDITDLASSEIVESGTYKGLSQSEAWMFKSLPALKEYWKVSNMDRSRKSFEFHNNATIDFPFTVTALMVKEDKEEEE